MLLLRTGKLLALFSLLFAAGCSTTGSAGKFFPAAGARSFKIESIPTGADVFVMGEKIGVTPIEISHKDVFPNIYPHEKESAYGRVTLKKTGCSDFTAPVSAEISNSGLHAKLDCAMKPAASGEMRHSGEILHSSETIEQRLDKIKDLLNKGLITEDEARKTRERILQEL